jgi:hypothetical protein
LRAELNIVEKPVEADVSLSLKGQLDLLWKFWKAVQTAMQQLKL